MNGDIMERLEAIGFSEYEAKSYLALLRESPVTGYQLSKLSGVPRSMIYEVMGKLVARGAVLTVRTRGSTQYAPLPAAEFFDQQHREHEQLIDALKDDLAALGKAPDLDYVWNIEGSDNIMAKAVEMIEQAAERTYVALLPATLQTLKAALLEAIRRGVRVVVYTTSEVELAGGDVIVVATPEQALGQAVGLGLILVIDGQEVLIGERLAANEARASWTSSPLLVFVAEHHLRTDLYLPRVLALLGQRALEVIQEEDRELFAHAFESHIERKREAGSE
jgi:sugar-specific transcriptional regulator TrmB